MLKWTQKAKTILLNWHLIHIPFKYACLLTFTSRVTLDNTNKVCNIQKSTSITGSTTNNRNKIIAAIGSCSIGSCDIGSHDYFNREVEGFEGYEGYLRFGGLGGEAPD